MEKTMLTRRQLTLGGIAVATASVAVVAARFRSGSTASAKTFEVSYTPEEWKKRLTPEQYAIMREEATERPYSSPLNNEKREGVFACAACELPLFESKTKFDSHTGWPSYYEPIQNAIGTSDDWGLGIFRSEVHCRRCGGHLGHIFEDGSPPTGLRYCINGIALKFIPA
jgi:peptide-methionine (R)-S-oxide reductase